MASPDEIQQCAYFDGHWDRRDRVPRWGTLYLTDEDDVPVDPGRYVRKYYRDSAPSGVVIGVTGLAMTGVGLWLLYREGTITAPGSVQPPIPAILTISISSSRVVLGINGTF